MYPYDFHQPDTVLFFFGRGANHFERSYEKPLMKNYPKIIDTTVTDEKLAQMIAHAHGCIPYETQLTMNNLLCIAASVPVFSPHMLYEVLGYQTDIAIVRTYLNRLVSYGYLKTFTLPKRDESLRTLYYITRQGFNWISSLMASNREFHTKMGKRLSETGMHDYGEGFAYVAYLSSPFRLQISYEEVTRFDAASMPSGRTALKSIRHDAILNIQDGRRRGLIYLEHDTGSEDIPKMTKKLPLYAAHGLMGGDADMILFTFRRTPPARPVCFQVRRINDLLAVMPDGVDISAYRNSPSCPPALLPVLDSMKRYTTAYTSHWTKREVTAYCDRLSRMTETSLHKFHAVAQDAFASSRRNGLINILLSAYKDRDPEYTLCIARMLSGFRVLCSAAHTLSSHLPIIHMEHYPAAISWLKDVLQHYYGNVEYIQDTKTYPNPLAGKQALTMHHIFHASNIDICAEYISCDVSAFLRGIALLDNTYDARSLPLSYVMIVDRYEDALTFARAAGYQYDIDQVVHGRLFLCFLLRGGDHLFMVGKNDKEIRLVK